MEQVNTPLSSGTEHGEFFSGSFGLLNGNFSYNAFDAEANREMAEILRRKMKTKLSEECGYIQIYSQKVADFEMS